MPGGSTENFRIFFPMVFFPSAIFPRLAYYERSDGTDQGHINHLKTIYNNHNSASDNLNKYSS